MIALKMLLTVAGVLMMAVAVAIPLYGVWIADSLCNEKEAGRRRTVSGIRRT